MKKMTRKNLALSTETVRRLADAQLACVAGGAMAPDCNVSCEWTGCQVKSVDLGCDHT
jgi:hypothetical protein